MEDLLTIREVFVELNSMKNNAYSFNYLYQFKGSLKEIVNRKHESKKIEAILKELGPSYRSNQIQILMNDKDADLFLLVPEIRGEVSKFQKLSDLSSSSSSALRGQADEIAKFSWKFIPQSEIDSAIKLLKENADSIDEMEANRKKAELKEKIILTITNVLVIGVWCAIPLLLIVGSCIELTVAWGNAFGVLVGLIYGIFRFACVLCGITFLWQDLIVGLPLDPIVTTSVVDGLLLLSIIYWIIADHTYYDEELKPSRGTVWAICCLFVFAFILGLLSYSIYTSAAYLIDKWDRPFWGVVVGFFYGIFKPLFGIIGGSIYAPAVYRGMVEPTFWYSVYIWIIAASFTAFGMMAQYEVVDINVLD